MRAELHAPRPHTTHAMSLGPILPFSLLLRLALCKLANTAAKACSDECRVRSVAGDMHEAMLEISLALVFPRNSVDGQYHWLAEK